MKFYKSSMLLVPAVILPIGFVVACSSNGSTKKMDIKPKAELKIPAFGPHTNLETTKTTIEGVWLGSNDELKFNLINQYFNSLNLGVKNIANLDLEVVQIDQSIQLTLKGKNDWTIGNNNTGATVTIPKAVVVDIQAKTIEEIIPLSVNINLDSFRDDLLNLAGQERLEQFTRFLKGEGLTLKNVDKLIPTIKIENNNLNIKIVGAGDIYVGNDNEGVQSILFKKEILGLNFLNPVVPISWSITQLDNEINRLNSIFSSDNNTNKFNEFKKMYATDKITEETMKNLKIYCSKYPNINPSIGTAAYIIKVEGLGPISVGSDNVLESFVTYGLVID